MFLATTTRPDLAFSVNYLSRFLDCFDHTHWEAAKRIVRYLKAMSNRGVAYKKGGSFVIVGYSDADYAHETEGRRSVSGFIFQLGGGPVSWMSRRQYVVALITTEAEYISASEAFREIVWLRRMMKDIGHRCEMGTTLFVDNQGALRLTKSPEFHHRTKHIDVRYYYIRERYECGDLDVEYLCSENQLTDICTKALPRDRFEKICNAMGLMDKKS